MTEYPYLVALALVEQMGKRSIPLGGKSLKKPIHENSDPGLLGQELAQQILLRVFQKSEVAPLKRANSDKSLLLIEIPIDLMQENIPLVKAHWIETGDNQKFISELRAICKRIWNITFSRDEGITFKKI